MASLYITVTFVTFAKRVFRVKVAVFIITNQSGFGSGHSVRCMHAVVCEVHGNALQNKEKS